MPLLEEMKYIPTERYAHQPELLEHARMIARNFGLYENACFGRTVNGLDWDDAELEWRVTTSEGDLIRARFVVMNFGVFGQPKLPAVPGWETFKGHMFHTSGWDYEYTGGSPEGRLTGLEDKRVAIIGTGATAIQAIPVRIIILFSFLHCESSMVALGSECKGTVRVSENAVYGCCERESSNKRGVCERTSFRRRVAAAENGELYSNDTDTGFGGEGFDR